MVIEISALANVQLFEKLNLKIEHRDLPTAWNVSRVVWDTLLTQKKGHQSLIKAMKENVMHLEADLDGKHNACASAIVEAKKAGDADICKNVTRFKSPF